MEREPTPSRANQNARRYRRAALVGLALSAALHVAAFLAWRGELSPLPATVAAGLRAGDAVAAPGSGVLEVIALAAPREIIVPPAPEPVSELQDLRIETRMPEEAFNARFVDLTASSASYGGAAVPGSPGAIGAGDGGSDVEGRFRVTAPEPRSIVPEWEPPRDVKGMRVMVRVLVDAQGRPTGDVELRPRTPDAGFNRRLIEKVLQMDYKPARRHGRPITAWAEMTFLF